MITLTNVSKNAVMLSPFLPIQYTFLEIADTSSANLPYVNMLDFTLVLVMFNIQSDGRSCDYFPHKPADAL